MIYKIRIILDSKEDVFRDVEVREKQTLYSLHNGIKSAFSLAGEELASFYQTDDKWNSGKEIPLEDMSDEGDLETMTDFYIKEALPEVGSKLLYVYDFYDMWTFFVEVVAITDKKAVLNYPLTVYRYGKMPLRKPKGQGVPDLDLSMEEEKQDLEMEDLENAPDLDPESFESED